MLVSRTFSKFFVFVFVFCFKEKELDANAFFLYNVLSYIRHSKLGYKYRQRTFYTCMWTFVGWTWRTWWVQYQNDLKHDNFRYLYHFQYPHKILKVTLPQGNTGSPDIVQITIRYLVKHFFPLIFTMKKRVTLVDHLSASSWMTKVTTVKDGGTSWVWLAGVLAADWSIDRVSTQTSRHTYRGYYNRWKMAIRKQMTKLSISRYFHQESHRLLILTPLTMYLFIRNATDYLFDILQIFIQVAVNLMSIYQLLG